MSVSADPTTAAPGDLPDVHEGSKNTVMANVNGLVVKIETKHCLICSNYANDQSYDLFWTETRHGHSPLVAFICRIAEVKLSSSADLGGGVACHTCFELINVLEKAELDFCRLKESFIAVISESPVFESSKGTTVPFSFLDVTVVKQETKVENNKSVKRVRKSSDDEPLARKQQTRKAAKKKTNIKPGEAAKKSNQQSLEINEDVNVIKEEIDTKMQTLLQQLKNSICEEKADNVDYMDAPDFSDDDYVPIKCKIKTNLTNKRTKQKEIRIPIKGDIDDLRKEVRQKRVMKPLKKEKSVHSCPHCPAKYNSGARLARHMMGHEMGKPPYICEVCGASYKHKKACEVHVAMHKGIGNWKCEECDKLFPSKGALQRHDAIHTGKSNYQCDLCGKSFIHLSSFKMHKLSHSGLKPHTCDVCGLSLMTRSHLKRHKRVHSGEKRHECPTCGKKFSERYNMLAHQKSHDAQTEAPKAQVHKTWKGFHCYLCDKRFERKYMLEKHMELIHERVLEKEPPKPRNTMTKLLKAQAAAGKAPSRNDTEADPDKEATQSSATKESSPSVKRETTADDADGNKHKTSLVSPDTTSENSGTFAEVVNGAWTATSFVAYSARQNEFPQ